MREIRNIRACGVMIFIILLVLAPIERFYSHPTVWWPYYHWELGFGHVFTNVDRWTLEVRSVNGVALNPPVPAEEFVRKHGGRWIANQDYKGVQYAGLEQFEKSPLKKSGYRRALEANLFRQFNIKEAQYSIHRYRIDPVHFRKNVSAATLYRSMDFEYDVKSLSQQN